MNINTIKYGTVKTVLLGVGQRVRQKRLALNLTQKQFSKKVGIGYDAYRGLETTGEISFKNIVLLAFYLDEVTAIHQLFTQNDYQNIDEVLKANESKKRKRASGNANN